ncbi:hypothetical protein SLS62_002275 [Diatrype stigma]|uniref:Uncharacterized protein n=1 Tax=Diatrype stigma TaxID=117547 RepID=A0AAN9UUB9_9PEZI
MAAVETEHHSPGFVAGDRGRPPLRGAVRASLRQEGDGDVALVAYEGAMNPLRGHGHGHHKILDSRYRHLREVGRAATCCRIRHEFGIVPGGRAALVGAIRPGKSTCAPSAVTRAGGGYCN